MHISLTAALEAYVRRKVESGLYNNASEVIREALRERIRVEAEYAADLDALRAEIDIGLKQAEAGEFVDYDMNDIKTLLREERRRRA